MVSGPATTLSLAPLGLRLKKTGLVLLGAIFLGGLLMAGSNVMGWNWLFWTGLVVGLLLAIMAFVMGLQAQLAPCPYCGSLVGLDSDNDLLKSDDNEPKECQKCHEWLLSNQGSLSPMDDAAFDKANGKARPPLFEDGRWPDECVTCGAPTTRHIQLSKNSIDGYALLVGSIRTRSAKVHDVPYCNDHDDQVKLEFNDDTPVFKFKDFGAMRRYVNVNFGKEPIKAKKK